MMEYYESCYASEYNLSQRADRCSANEHPKLTRERQARTQEIITSGNKFYAMNSSMPYC